VSELVSAALWALHFDHEACAAVTEIAERAGAGGLVALDLYTEVRAPTCREQTL
jgi:hypothetical protein